MGQPGALPVGDRSRPRVSVVIPAYQAERFICDALDSAARQTMSELEIVVIDDASTDATVERVEQAALGDPRIRLDRLSTNGGPGAARNRGIDLARGDWICLLDADDGMDPDRIERLLEIAGRVGADMISDNLLLCPPDGAAPRPMLACEAFGATRRMSFAEFVRGNIFYKNVPARVSLGFMQPLISRAFLDANAIRYPPNVRSGEDFIFYLSCFAADVSWWITPQPWYHYHIRLGSLTDQQSPRDMEQIIGCEEDMIAFAKARHDDELVRALQRHKRDLDRPYLYAAFTGAVKSRELAEARKILVRKPGAARLILEHALTQMPSIAAKALRGGYSAHPNR